MGPKQSTSNPQHPNQQIQVNHPHFKNVKLIHQKDGDLLQITIPAISDKDIKRWQQEYKKFSSWDSLLLPVFYEYKGTNMCGNNGHCNINYDDYRFLLKEEINDRRGVEKKYFQNIQLWYLTFTLIETAHAFHSGGKKIGDVRPLNVFISDNGHTKVGNQLSWPNQYNNYEKVIFDKEVTYLAPEEVIDLNYGKHEPRGQFQIAEAFSIGLTLLDSVLLIDSHDLYNLSTNRFDYQRLSSRIKEMFELKYLDKTLKMIISGLCLVDDKIRLTSRMLYTWLHNYKENITNLESFQFKEVPHYINNSAFYPNNDRPVLNRPSSSLRVPGQPPSYIQSQVVSNSPQKVIIARQQQYTQNGETNRPPNSYIQIPPNHNGDTNRPPGYNQMPPNQNGQTNRPPSSYIQLPPTQIIENKRPPNSYMIPDAQRRQQVVERRIITQERDATTPQPTVVEHMVVSRTTPIHQSEIVRSTETKVVHMQVAQTPSPAASRKNDDFRSTLQKIEQQLALSRKLYPSP